MYILFFRELTKDVSIVMMLKLQTILFYVIIALISLCCFIFVSIPIYLLNPRYKYKYVFAVIFSYIFIYLLRFICGIRFQVDGLEKLPKDKKPYLALANHQSFWENFFMQIIIPEHTWIIKKELYDIPVFGTGLKWMNPIAVDRGASMSIRQILQIGTQRLKDGISIVMFPEGTRLAVLRNVKFKPSAAKLAIEANAPILLLVHNAGLFWPTGFWLKRRGVVTVKILEYIDCEKIKLMDVRQLNDYIETFINTEKNLLINHS